MDEQAHPSDEGAQGPSPGPMQNAGRGWPPAHLVVPGVTLAAAVGALYTMAAPREVVGVRVWGGPTSGVGGSTHAVRLQCLRRSLGVDDRRPLDDLDVEIGAERRRARCDDEGHAEVHVGLPRGDRVRVAVRRRGEVLADGEAMVTPAEWASGAVERAPQLRGGGTLPLRAEVDGGSVQLGRWATVRLLLAEELRAPGALRVSVTGGSSRPPRPAPGGLDVDTMATFITASITVEQALPPTIDGKPPPTWEAWLPVQSGALAADEISQREGTIEAVVRAPSPRRRAYVGVQDEIGRRAAVAVDLAPDGQGGAWGRVSLKHDPWVGHGFLLISSSPSWPIDGTTSIAIGPSTGPRPTRVVPDRPWVDGLTPAAARQRGHERRVEAATAVFLAAAAVLEALLLVARGRAERRRLAEHLATFADEQGAAPASLEQADSGLRLGIAVVGALFGFALLTLVLLARVG